MTRQLVIHHLLVVLIAGARTAASLALGNPAAAAPAVQAAVGLGLRWRGRDDGRERQSK